MVAIVAGIAAGVIGAVPGLCLARSARRGGRPSVTAGLATILASFGLLTVAIGMAYKLLGPAWTGFAAATTATYLGLWSAEAALAWRWMRRTSGEVSADGGV